MFEAQMHVLWQFKVDAAAPGSQRRARQRLRAHLRHQLLGGGRLSPALVNGCSILAVGLNPKDGDYNPALREQHGKGAGGVAGMLERK